MGVDLLSELSIQVEVLALVSGNLRLGRAQPLETQTFGKSGVLEPMASEHRACWNGSKRLQASAEPGTPRVLEIIDAEMRWLPKVLEAYPNPHPNPIYL